MHPYQVDGFAGSVSVGADHSKYATDDGSPASSRARPAATFAHRYGDLTLLFPAVDTTHSCASARVIIAGRIACSPAASTRANASSMIPRSNVLPCPAVSVVDSIP